jgi:hypothetical protein
LRAITILSGLTSSVDFENTLGVSQTHEDPEQPPGIGCDVQHPLGALGDLRVIVLPEPVEPLE